MRSFYFRLEIKNGDHYYTFSFELCSPLGPTNPFYWRHLIYVYTIYVSEKLGLGEREEGGRGNNVHQTMEQA